jgi:hypothetical protein
VSLLKERKLTEGDESFHSELRSSTKNTKNISKYLLKSESYDEGKNDTKQTILLSPLRRTSHRKTSSALEIKSNIFKENREHIKYHRNSSGLDRNNSLNNKTSEANNQFESESNLMTLINKNETKLISSLCLKSESEKNSPKKNENFEIDLTDQTSSNNLNIPNLLLSLQNLNAEPFYNTERQQVKNPIEDLKKPVSNRSERRSSNIFLIQDKSSEKLKTYSGPVDLNCITSLPPQEMIETISEFLNKKKISFIQTNPYKLRCSKNGISFDFEVYKFDLELNYLKFKLNQGGDYTNYRKLVQNIMYNLNI